MAETKPGRLDQSRSCRFLKVATHPFRALGGLRVKKWVIWSRQNGGSVRVSQRYFGAFLGFAWVI